MDTGIDFARLDVALGDMLRAGQRMLDFYDKHPDIGTPGNEFIHAIGRDTFARYLDDWRVYRRTDVRAYFERN